MCKLVLVGYMGSGKSVLAKKLAEKLNISFVELDDLIEEKAKMTIKTIFSDKGELYFRKLEHQLFLEKMESNESFVLSTGGGTPCYFNNHEVLKQTDSVSIYLKASIDTLYSRLKNQRESRPLLAQLGEGELREFIAKHLFERSYFYNQAKHIVVVDDKSIDDIVKEIEKFLL
ncbi:shikimate kinase [Flavobacterium sp.]|uniref:shikimate kinase n=1 Tax=Flavobacterium sp. TaxID=239 RepID=UPI002B4B226A|nr:shikimate kinase [Flavobacterium sp.]HLP63826.1 shikimate kinase [Flavobacterium sp.]